MDLGRRSEFIALCLVFLFIKNDVTCQKTDELGEMRSMLRSSLEQNRKLERQNNRLKLIWAGLQQMCSALQMSPCDCDSSSSNDTKINETDTSTVVTPVQTVTVLSVTSVGLVDNKVDVAVNYMAPPEHSSDWIVRRVNDGMVRTSGNRTSKLADINGTTVNVYTSSFTIGHYNQSRLVLQRIHTETKSLSLEFNLTSLEEPGKQILPEFDTKQGKLNKSYQVQNGTDLNIMIPIDGDQDYQTELLSGTDVYFTGLNTSVYPPILFEIENSNYASLDLSIGRRNESSVLRITLRYPYAQYGGILSYRLRHYVEGYVAEFFNGDLIKILSPQTNTVVAPNSLGVYNLPKQTLVYPPSQSITCFAMGNPRPDVYILKKSQNGSPKEMPSETLIMDSLYSIKAYTVYTQDKKHSIGKYICRAVSGNTTVDVMTEVVITEPIMFDELRTGLIKNTTKKIVIACRASGWPRPILEMRLQEHYGPDLLKYGAYKVSKTEPNQTTSRVTLTIPAKEVKINTVYCIATYSQRNSNTGKFKKIEVYPGMENNWEFFNMVSEKVDSMKIG